MGYSDDKNIAKCNLQPLLAINLRPVYGSMLPIEHFFASYLIWSTLFAESSSLHHERQANV